MPTTQQHERHEEIDQYVREALDVLIGQQILNTLGKPGNLLGVQVRPLWKGRYRANIFVGESVASATVAHSYFLAVDSDGTITAATPKITKQY
jgi:hypothetical protein